jgi:leucyl-tRNA synthetase
MDRIAEHAEKQGFGRRTVNYRIRDWGISRQRYWGCPIPMIYCDKCGEVPVQEKDLPVTLPTQVDFRGDSRSPLGSMPEFLDVTCPKCGGRARRETDTMDTFVDSSWYYAKYTSPGSPEIFDKKESEYWMPVDQYIGGIEHAVLHLLYARFFNMVMKDLGLLKNSEPFTKLLTQGMVIKDGFKMSKSKGNVVDPDEIIRKYGADTVRMFMLFAAPPQKDLDWSDKGVEGSYRFLSRVWRFVNRYSALYLKDAAIQVSHLSEALRKIRIELHRALKMITTDIEERMQYNTAIARMMELLNAMYQVDENEWKSAQGRAVLSELLNHLLPVLAPFAPHAAEEMWETLGNTTMLAGAPWPSFIEELSAREETELVFQINGKIRAKVKAPADISKSDMEKMAMENERIAEAIEGARIVRVIAVPGKLVNIVIK